MKIFPRILLNTLPLIILGMVIVGGLNFYLAQGALNNLAEKWLTTKLNDANRIASENLGVLRKYGLENIYANVEKAQQHTGEEMQDINLGKGGYIWILDSKGKVVMHPDEDVENTSMQQSRLFTDIKKSQFGKSFHEVDGREMLFVYKYFPAWDWYIFASAPLSELYGEANRMRTYMLLAGMLALMLTSIVLLILARRLSAPINTLATEVTRYGSGDNQNITRLHRGDEIGTLSIAFSEMSNQLNNRMAQEKLISEISASFIHLSPEKIDDAIQLALQKIGEFTGAGRCYVAEFLLQEGYIGQTHEWCREGVESHNADIMGLSLESVPWFMDQLQRRGYTLASSLEFLPREAAAEKKIWQERKLQSVVRVAMVYRGELRGFVGLDATKDELSWDEDTVLFLQRIADIFCNTMERLWYQQSLAREKERLAVTLQSIGDGVFTTDVAGNIVLMNKVGENLTGWKQKDAVSRYINEVMTLVNENSREIRSVKLDPQADPERLEDILSESLLVSREGDERLVEGSVAAISERDGRRIGYVLVLRDITEKRQMEDELIKVEKLQSIGVLAGGIAHDFNNILTAIIGNISLAKHHASSNVELLEKMDDIETASYRARDLTQQLLTFSKGGDPVKKTLSFTQLFRESAAFSLGGTNIKLEYKPADDIWAVDGDEGQLSQVINNLIINAVQAMPEGGIVHAEIENHLLQLGSGLPLVPGKYVKLTLRDSGIGIPKINQSRIFDPFFTTKSKGSGLGLASAYSILEKHGGYIIVDSTVGFGTTFTVFLPASDLLPETLAKESLPLQNTTGKILLMDDEKEIRDVVGSMLSAIGYDVVYARDGTEMLEKYSVAMQNGKRFGLVLMDLTIPGGMGGREAIEALLNMDPAARAVVSSGYSNDPVLSDFKKYGFMGSVTKPYGIEELCTVLKEVGE